MVHKTDVAEVAKAGTTFGYNVLLRPAAHGSGHGAVTARLERPAGEIQAGMDLAGQVFIHALASDQTPRAIADRIIERLRTMGTDPDKRPSDQPPVGGE